MLEFLEKNKVNVRKSMQLVSNEAVKQAINAGLGFSIVPLIGLRTALKNENMQIFPLKGLPIITKWNLIYSQGKNLTPAQNALIEYIQINKEQLVEEHFDWAVHPEGFS